MIGAHDILILKDREDLYYQDYDNFKTLKIAATESLVGRTGISDYLTSVGYIDNVVYYEEYNDCYDALLRGEVDAVISNVMDMTDEMKMLDRFCVTTNYITAVKGNKYYSLLNNALTSMKLSEPSFQSDLYEKYYPDRVNIPLNKEETEYLESAPVLKVGIYADREPVSFYNKETDEYDGIAVQIMNLMGEKMGIQFEYIPIGEQDPNELLRKQELDLMMPGSGQNIESDMFCTNSLFDNDVVMAILSGKTMPTSGYVGVVSSKTGIAHVLGKDG